MLQVDKLTKSFGDRVLFEDLTFAIDRGQRIGLIAPNGAGKTTLMNILVGVEPYDRGLLTYENDLRWAYLPQSPTLPQTGTVLEACFSSYDPVARLVAQWEQALAEDDQTCLERLLPEMESAQAWDYEQRAKEILDRLGIKDFKRSVAHLSGGEAKRIALAATLISAPELLLLDEPTNHLDLKSIEWLEGYLARSSVSLVLITHDRYFLDRVCNQILELDRGQLYRYRGNYDYYLAKKEERRLAEAEAESRASNLYRRELEWMRRQPQARGTKARYRIEAFHELEGKLHTKRSGQRIDLGNAGATYIGKKIFEVESLSKSYGSRTILKDFDYIFSRGDKIGIVGENGVGKTTFLRLLLGLEQPDAGTIDIGSTVRFGYYSQEAPSFAPEARVIDVIQDIAEQFASLNADGSVLSASQILTQFLFPVERQYTEVGKLSGGELRRLYLCSVLVTSPNFLVLDEPTNDLDILTLQVLEEYLADFSGCVLIVSHDRFFMDKVVGHLLAFEGEGMIRDFPGNYSLYRAWREEREAQQRLAEKATTPKSEAPSRAPRERTPRLSFAERRELEDINRQMPLLEEEHRSLEQAMSSGGMSSEALMQASVRLAEIIERMDCLTLRQLELEEKDH